ncbi:MAG: hypothetical protein NZZ41_01345 [Candidatus Dojkabacteria bacterium]|nr:hypothetical protein [Candidatus Dojkabacteria bacterium]
MFKRNYYEGFFVPASVLSLYQEGGELIYQEDDETKDPMQELLMMAQQALEEQNPELAMQVCQMLVEMMLSSQQEAVESEEMEQEMPSKATSPKTTSPNEDNEELAY